MQLVFEFGSDEARPVVEAIRRAVGRLSYAVKYLPNGSEDWIPSSEPLDSVAAWLERGEISAFSLHPKDGIIRYALALCPFFEGAQRSFHLGTIESTEKSYQPIWELILGTPGLKVACLGYEEGLELEDTQLTVETFPWNHWPLVVGALRDPLGSSSWTTREGPGMKSFAGAGGNGHGYGASK